MNYSLTDSPDLEMLAHQKIFDCIVCVYVFVYFDIGFNDTCVKCIAERIESMQLLVLNLFFLDHQLRTTFGLRLIDNGLGPPKYGEEETIFDFALLAADQKATLPSQVQQLM